MVGCFNRNHQIAQLLYQQNFDKAYLLLERKWESLTQEQEMQQGFTLPCIVGTYLPILIYPTRESSMNFATMWDLKLIRSLICIMGMQGFNLLKANLIMRFMITLHYLQRAKMMASQGIQIED